MAKFAKEAVGFEHPAEGANHCGQCVHFERPESCEIVAGEIQSEDWCRKFKKRALSREAAERVRMAANRLSGKEK